MTAVELSLSNVERAFASRRSSKVPACTGRCRLIGSCVVHAGCSSGATVDFLPILPTLSNAFAKKDFLAGVSAELSRGGMVWGLFPFSPESSFCRQYLIASYCRQLGFRVSIALQYRTVATQYEKGQKKPTHERLTREVGLRRIERRIKLQLSLAILYTVRLPILQSHTAAMIVDRSPRKEFESTRAQQPQTRGPTCEQLNTRCV